ncbi:hypothetical protein V8C43DRAFT_286664 [Trichoderma afarasin]
MHVWTGISAAQGLKLCALHTALYVCVYVVRVQGRDFFCSCCMTQRCLTCRHIACLHGHEAQDGE